MSEKDRLSKIIEKLKSVKLYFDFMVISANDNAQVILKTEKPIPANERGVLLLNMEGFLKESVEKAITIWLEPVGDKSKLRNLRGISFKSEDES